MAPNVDIVVATEAHAVALGVDMRSADVAEVWASGRLLPIEAVKKSMAVSVDSWTLLIDGQVAAVFGVAEGSLLSGLAHPWALTSDLIAKHPRVAYQVSLVVLDYLREKYPFLVNAIDARNTKALAWARKVGFKVPDEPTALGSAGEPFHPILMTREVDHV